MSQNAVLLNKANSDNVCVYYENIYTGYKSKRILPGSSTIINFNENSYQPTLIHFVTRAPWKGAPPLLAGQLLIEQPVLVMLPGDSIAVKYDDQQNTFEFTGKNQIELNFYKRIWQNQLSLSQIYFEMHVPATKVPLAQFLKKWYELKLEGESLITEIEHTVGVRPEIASFLARQLRLRIFTILTLPAVYQFPKDSLRVFTKAYTDSVAKEASVLLAFRNAPATATDGLVNALSAYISYDCVRRGQYPTHKARYLLAKQEYSGFQRAWVCFFIIEEARLKHKNISWLLQDYQRWVHPYDEFVRVLKGDPTVPLRSYKGMVFADSLTDAEAQARSLSDVLGRYKGQVVLLDLWASWCRPCLEELPASVALANKYRGKGLVVLFLSIDKDPADWRQAFKHLPQGIRNLYRFNNPGNSVFIKELDVSTIPRYVLLDRHGQIRYPDALRPSDPRLEPILEKLLKL